MNVITTLLNVLDAITDVSQTESQLSARARWQTYIQTQASRCPA